VTKCLVKRQNVGQVFQAKRGVAVKVDVFRLGLPARPHEVMLVVEKREIVERAWANRRPDYEYLFHVDGQPLGSIRGAGSDAGARELRSGDARARRAGGGWRGSESGAPAG
jgi:hypothetical protein